MNPGCTRTYAQPESRRNAHEERDQLFSWMTEMLEGSELDEPMTLTQVVTRFLFARHDGAW
ncbi:hypothetical protein ACLB1T_12245 [Escherichia coli]